MTKDKRTALNGVTLQHRHFAFIAHTISEMRSVGDNTSNFDADRVARHFAHACKSTNPNFDYARFLAACGVKDE